MPHEQDIRVPCYACGRVDKKQGQTYASPPTEPDGLMRLCRKHKRIAYTNAQWIKRIERLHRRQSVGS